LCDMSEARTSDPAFYWRFFMGSNPAATRNSFDTCDINTQIQILGYKGAVKASR
jgi:hypothetical protein